MQLGTRCHPSRTLSDLDKTYSVSTGTRCLETAPYATELLQGCPLEANVIKIMVCGKCAHRVLGTKAFKASLPVIQLLFYVSWKTEGLYLPHVLPKMQGVGVGVVKGILGW